MNRLSVEHLEHRRNDIPLFGNLSSDWESGDLVQVIGPNGSGKTTFLRIVCGLIRPSGGNVSWNGHAPSSYEFLSSLLYLGHQIGIKSQLTPLENLRWYFGLNGRKSVSSSALIPSEAECLQALSELGLLLHAHSPCYSLSAGQQRRAALARLYLSQAPLWILDEPFTAIDKQGVQALEALIQSHTERGGIVLVTTHQSFQVANRKTLDLEQYKAGEQLFDD
jgi:heme exporter protein A